MRPEDLDKTKKLIQTSGILSSVERAEWSQLLPEMNDKQVLELIRILDTQKQAFKSAAQPAPQQPSFHSQQKSQPTYNKVNIAQKEIGTSRPFYEQEIAAPKPQSNNKSQQVYPAPMDPAELQKKVANIVQKIDHSKAAIPDQAPVAPLPPVNLPVAPLPRQSANVDLQQFLETESSNIVSQSAIANQPSAYAPESQPSQQSAAESFTLNTAADFAKLTPNFLDDKNLRDVHEQLMQAIEKISRKEHAYEIVSNFEASPLQAAYVALGAELLNDSNPNRLLAYENAQKNLEKKGLPSLNKEEFEFITDLRAYLQQLY